MAEIHLGLVRSCVYVSSLIRLPRQMASGFLFLQTLLNTFAGLRRATNIEHAKLLALQLVVVHEEHLYLA